MTGRLTLIGTAATVPAGVLTWDAWAALRAATLVLGSSELAPEWEPALGEVAFHRVDIAANGGMPRLARRLVGEADAGGQIVWLGSPDGDVGLAVALAHELTGLGGEQPALEVVLGAWDSPGSAVLELVEVMDRLRSPGGCPWDAEQTHQSLAPYALEEAYEVVEAIEHGTRDDLVEELGDLLLQVVFHARVGEEGSSPEADDGFDLDHVAQGITAKLRRRHPHVFGDVHAPTAAHVEANWEQIKQAEKGRDSAFDGVPVGLPALSRAQKTLGRFDRASLTAPEFATLSDGSPGSTLAVRVLALVGAARREGVDLESAVRDAVRRLDAVGREAEHGH